MTPELRAAYAKVFDMSDPAVCAVLSDLKTVCRVPEAPVARNEDGSTDALQSMRLIGKQEVFNRIRSGALIDDRALFALRSLAPKVGQ